MSSQRRGRPPRVGALVAGSRLGLDAVPHGFKGYNRGCRCFTCRLAFAEYRRERRAARKVTDPTEVLRRLPTHAMAVHELQERLAARRAAKALAWRGPRELCIYDWPDDPDRLCDNYADGPDGMCPEHGA